MFGEQKLAITFGPWQDALLMIAVGLIIFVLGAAAVNMVINEVKSWFKVDDEVAKSLYEIEWGDTFQFDTFQTRVHESVEEAAVILLRENGDGYIRYRPYVAGDEFEWGTPQFRDNASLMNPLYGNAIAAMRNYAGKDVEETANIWPKWMQPQAADPAPDNEELQHTVYIIEWATSRHFEPGDTRATFLTQYPEIKIEEIINELGPGWIRYKLANDDSDNPWIPNGYVTKETINAKTDSAREAG